MSFKTLLKDIVNHSDLLLSDVHTFLLLGVNNPADGVWSRLSGKGNFLSALGIFAVLSLYSRVYAGLKMKKSDPLTKEEKEKLEGIAKIVKEYALDSAVIVRKEPGLFRFSDDSAFERFIKDFRNSTGIDIGLKDEDLIPVWKKVRNMMTHLSFPAADIRMKSVQIDDEEAVTKFKLPN